MFSQPSRSELCVWSEIPEPLRAPRESEWSALALDGRKLGCFLEGPAFDADGELHVVDIPFGRIFRIGRNGDWALVAEYAGWPNGLKIIGDRFLVADYRLGLLRLAPPRAEPDILLDRWNDRPLLGLNDLTVMPDGSIYVTDQGTSGLHRPAGRVFRLSPDGVVDCLLNNGPSPNGIVYSEANGILHVAMTRANAVWRIPLSGGIATKVGVAIQLSGGIGPDGLALDPQGNLLVAHPPIGVWHFDRNNMPIHLYAAPTDSYPTNLAVSRDGDATRMFVTDSFNGRILSASLIEPR